MELTLRPAGGDEAATLTAIAFAAKRHWGYPEPWIELWRDDLTVDDNYLATRWTAVAAANGEARGWCALADDPEEAWLEHCWVRPDSLGQGVGRLLVDGARAEAARRGAPWLGVVSDPNAAGFYEKLGFRLIGHQPSVPADRRLPVLALAL